MNNFWESINRLRLEQIPFCIATIVKVTGSSPQDLGAKAIITQEGLYFGTVGGGKIELKVISHAIECLNKKTYFDCCEWNLQKDIGMTCGGLVSFTFESYLAESNFKIAIFGAGHVAQELVQILSKVNCKIKCIDPRSEWVMKLPVLNHLEKIQTNEMDKIIDTLTDDYFIVSLTMGHAYDRPILRSALKRNFKFVGVMGSDQKSKILRNELVNIDGLSINQIENLKCPIGESFGTNAPYEIGLSIVAQLIRIRDMQ